MQQQDARLIASTKVVRRVVMRKNISLMLEKTVELAIKKTSGPRKSSGIAVSWIEKTKMTGPNLR